jgi:hypothetical protein
MIIDPHFPCGPYDYFFSYGLASVRFYDTINGCYKYGYINKEGAFVIKPQYSEAYPFSEGIAFVREDEGRNIRGSDNVFRYVKAKGYLINKEGKRINDFQFDEVGGFSEGLACVRIDDEYGYIDTRGDLVIEPQFDVARDFSEGLAAVGVGGGYNSNSIEGYINSNGKFVINPQFNSAYPFINGLAQVVIDKEIGCRICYINKNGNVVAEWDQ